MSGAARKELSGGFNIGGRELREHRSGKPDNVGSRWSALVVRFMGNCCYWASKRCWGHLEGRDDLACSLLCYQFSNFMSLGLEHRAP